LPYNNVISVGVWFSNQVVADEIFSQSRLFQLSIRRIYVVVRELKLNSLDDEHFVEI